MTREPSEVELLLKVISDMATVAGSQCARIVNLRTRVDSSFMREVFYGKDGELIEKLAALEHEQWVQWSKHIAKTETITPGRLNRWQELWVPYEKLSEELKGKDREWARKVLEVIRG